MLESNRNTTVRKVLYERIIIIYERCGYFNDYCLYVKRNA
jgi:hypothetical protein